jgi:vacuolar-type H+-ATPase subunit I/STV1
MTGDDLQIPDGMNADRGSSLDEEAKTTERFVHDLVDALGQIEKGNISKAVSFRDKRTAALFSALKDNPEKLQQAVEDARAVAGVDDDSEGDRSELLRLLVRIGVGEVTPDLADAEKQARLKRIEDDY